ncbi:hypothetical protein RI367_006622 [Sorochytrium milnesiophthora]
MADTTFTTQLAARRASSLQVNLQGDRVLLPTSVIEQLHHVDFQLLTFELQREVDGNIKRMYCGVRQFSASEGEIIVPDWVADALAITDDAAVDAVATTSYGGAGDVQQQQVLLRLTLRTLPKATSAQFRPLTMDYLDIPDLRATLESFIRTHYTCITRDTVIPIVHYHRGTARTYSFMVTDLHPAEYGACSLIDTDLTVDIVPLEGDVRAYEEAKLREKSTGPVVLTWTDATTAAVQGHLAVGERRYYKLPLDKGLSVLELSLSVTTGDANLFAHTVVEQPSAADNIFFDVDCGSRKCSFTLPQLQPQEDWPPFLFITVEQYGDAAPLDYSISVAKSDGGHHSPVPDNPPPSDDRPAGAQQCTNCLQWIAPQTFPLHEAFCRRNNYHCSLCGAVMPKAAQDAHWHCPHCLASADFSGQRSMSEQLYVCHSSEAPKHLHYFHSDPPAHRCPLCTSPAEVFQSLSQLQRHRQEVCPHRLIFCRYCKTYQEAQGPAVSARDILAGIATEHESACAARTIECQQCGKIVQIKDVGTHMQWHDVMRRTQPVPFQLCTNAVCSNASAAQNEFGLCSTCFGPFWTGSNDPGHQILIKKLVQRYFTQLRDGCGQLWCTNSLCKSSSSSSSSTAADEQAQDPTSLALRCYEQAQVSVHQRPNIFHLCVRQPAVARRRTVANRLSTMGWRPEWAVKALQETDLARRQQEHAGNDDDDNDEEDDDALEQAKVWTDDEWMSASVEWLTKHAPPPTE